MINKDKALKLAGKLAIAARKVCISDARTVSDHIITMEIVLDEYDNYIFSEIKEESKNGKEIY